MQTSLYPKINAPYKRNFDTGKLLIGDWALPEFELLQHIIWAGYEKIDGTNIRVHYDGNDVVIAGRTNKAQIPKHLLEKLQSLFTKDSLARVFPDFNDGDSTVTLYGEGCGHKIQKDGGKYCETPTDVNFILFDVKIGRWWLAYDNVRRIAVELGVPVTPIMTTSSFFHCVDLVTDGLTSTFGDFYAEGLVIKPLIDLFDRRGQRIVTKIKHSDFFKGE